jgi:exopolysaccharide biosynthesis polyprenyl glycosylphosphotransferase
MIGEQTGSKPRALEARGPDTAAPRSLIARWPRLTYLVTDGSMMAVAYLALSLAPLGSDARNGLGWATAFSLAVLSLLARRGAYSGPYLRADLLDDLGSVLAAVLVALMALISARALLGADAEVAREVVLHSGYAAAFLMLGRICLASVLGHPSHRHRISRPTLIFGAGRVGNLAARRLLSNCRVGLDPVGFLDEDPLALPGKSATLPVLGGPRDIDSIVARHRIEHLLVCFSSASHELILSVVRRCWELGVSVSVVPRLYELQGDRAPVSRLGGLPIVSVASARSSGVAITVKYALDRVVAAVILIALAPLMAAIALGIKASTGGHVFFAQPRVGRDGRHFTMWKFRTMTGTPESDGQANAEWVEAVISGQRSSVAGGPAAQLGADRTTLFGHWLRRCALDELPQLWNVLRGEMSLIGPRPEQVPYVERFEQAVYRYRDRERVKSGITGWAQVNGLRGDTSLADRVEWDNYYIENWAPWLDVKILLKTIAVLWRGYEPGPGAELDLQWTPYSGSDTLRFRNDVLASGCDRSGSAVRDPVAGQSRARGPSGRR